MELNASDERGINIIRSKVKSFSQVRGSIPASSPSDHVLVWWCEVC
jgi:DNA polymerase III delta prime subunit